jgi:hypothetical protein
MGASSADLTRDQRKWPDGSHVEQSARWDGMVRRILEDTRQQSLHEDNLIDDVTI